MSFILISVCHQRQPWRKRLLTNSNVIKGMLFFMDSLLNSEETNHLDSVWSMITCNICVNMNLNIDWGKPKSFLRLTRELEERFIRKLRKSARKLEELKSLKSRLVKSEDQVRLRKLKKISLRLTSDQIIITIQPFICFLYNYASYSISWNVLLNPV